MIPPHLVSRPVQSGPVGQTINPVVTGTQLPVALTPPEDTSGGLAQWLFSYSPKPVEAPVEGETLEQTLSRLNPSRKVDDMYEAVAKGDVKVGSGEFNSLFSDEDRALSAGEFARFNPEVQAWAKTNPREFIQSLLANRNSANGDIASIGAEGGYANPELTKAGKGGLDFSNAGYMQIHDDNDFMSLLPLALNFIPGLQGLGTMVGDLMIGSSFLSPVVGNAVIGGAMSGLTGGNPLTGALAGGLGSFVSGSNIGGQMGISDPAIRGAVNNLASSGTRQLVSSGQLNPESLLFNAGLDVSGAPPWLKPVANLGLTNSSNRGLPSRNTVGGLSQYLTSGLPSTSLATRQPRRPSWSRP